MTEPTEKEPRQTSRESVAGWTAGVSAVFLSVTLGNTPEWPVALGVTAIATMVASVCLLILRGR